MGWNHDKTNPGKDGGKSEANHQENQ